MEEGVLSPGKMLGSLSGTSMDFDYMDELLLDGCWLETAVGSEFLNLSPSNSADLFDSSLLWPISETNGAEMTVSTSNKDTEQVEKVSSSLPGNMSLNDPPVRNLRNSQSLGHVSGVSAREDGESEGSELNRRWWIGPRAMPGYGASVVERLMRALWYMKQAIKEKDVLIQIWVPENRGGKRVLRTHDDLFALDPSCWKLANYREVSANYQFLAEEDSKDLAGLPGRVFLGKVPEWTPDVRFFKSDEYPRVDHAQRCEVSGTLALPVFEQGSRNCLGVIEVVTTEQKIKYRPELENVCKALEAVDLRSSEVLSMQNLKECDTSYKAALPEIQELLRSACETHRLPLAQTWVPCIWQGKGGCRHSDENYVHCVSTVDRACHVVDPGIQPFHEACSEHHLLKGQGVAGGAFLTNQPCFSSDITLFSKTEYPLVHHAKVFKLCAAVAIRLRSLHTGKVDFVLEFFLPVDCRDPEEQKKMLASLSIVIQRVCHTLRVVTNKELEEETGSSLNEVLNTSDSRPSAEMNQPELYPRGDARSLKELKQKRDITSTYQAEKPEEQLGKKSADCRKEQKENTLEGECGEKCAHVDVDRMGEKRRTKAEKTISLEVLRQYFAGSLKDAAKNIGVCPTTLKRICRRHGIQRWPSRKIKKVGHSLQKIQHVIDSVQGTSGAVQIGSFYETFPALASSSTSRASPLSTLEPTDHPRPSGPQPERGIFNSQLGPPTSPSSSCSQSSSSSHSCSSGTHQHQSALMFSAYVDSMLKDLPVDGVLKRVRSNSELHSSSQERTKLMPRSLSHKSLIEQLDSRNPASLPENGSHSSPKIDSQRVKVTYGGENIRFRMPNSWGFRDLEQEVARRFNIGDMSKFVLKYLDDDFEWILITCDDDLQECTDVCGSSKTSIIRLMLQVSPSTSRNLVSNGPS